jgi:hypothetical protein
MGQSSTYFFQISDENQLTTIPSTIARMTDLKKLYLRKFIALHIGKSQMK